MDIVVIEFCTTYNRSSSYIDENKAICTYKILHFNPFTNQNSAYHVFIIEPEIVSIIISICISIHRWQHFRFGGIHKNDLPMKRSQFH